MRSYFSAGLRARINDVHMMPCMRKFHRCRQAPYTRTDYNNFPGHLIFSFIMHDD